MKLSQADFRPKQRSRFVKAKRQQKIPLLRILALLLLGGLLYFQLDYDAMREALTRWTRKIPLRSEGTAEPISAKADLSAYWSLDSTHLHLACTANGIGACFQYLDSLHADAGRLGRQIFERESAVEGKTPQSLSLKWRFPPHSYPRFQSLELQWKSGKRVIRAEHALRKDSISNLAGYLSGLTLAGDRGGERDPGFSKMVQPWSWAPWADLEGWWQKGGGFPVRGLRFHSRSGDPVFPLQAGKIVETGVDRARGQYLRLRLEDGWEAWYANLKALPQGLEMGTVLEKTDTLGWMDDWEGEPTLGAMVYSLVYGRIPVAPERMAEILHLAGKDEGLVAKESP